MTVSTWSAHAGREPADDVVAGLHEWWAAARGPVSDITVDPGLGGCVWRLGPLHTLVHMHVNFAAHKRRRPVVYVSHNVCDGPGPDHGVTAMSTVVPDDPYGPEPYTVHHSAPQSALHYAYDLVAREPNTLAVTVMSEAEFTDPEFYHLHRASHLNAYKGGVVLPVLMVPPAQDLLADKEAAASREDVLRALGFASYSIDIEVTSDTVDQHRDFAALMEDVCDDIYAIKADAAARTLTYEPHWPLIVVRAAKTWEYSRPRIIDGQVVDSEPGAGGA